MSYLDDINPYGGHLSPALPRPERIEPRWEYKRIYDYDTEELNELGAQGWEAYAAYATSWEGRDGFMDTTHYVCLKRQVRAADTRTEQP